MNATPLTMRRRWTSVVTATLVALLAVLSIGPASAQEADGPTRLVAHRVDARENPVEITLLADEYDVSPLQVTVREDWTDREVIDATTATAQGRSSEVVFVLDTDQRMLRADAFETMVASVQEEIRSLPAGTTVGVVQAGSSAITITEPTSDLRSAAAELDRIEISNGALLVNAVDRGVSMFTNGGDTIRTLVVIAGGEDTGSKIDLGTAQAIMIERGIQVVTVSQDGGSSTVRGLAPQVGGLDVAVATPDDLAAAVRRAGAAASDRLVIEYNGITEISERADVQLTVGEASTTLSFGGGELVTRIPALEAIVVPEPGRFDVLTSGNALYVIIGLSFIAIALAIYIMGVMFAGGETNLEGMLAKYANGGDDAELDEHEASIVQTALVRRAVEISESFAEDRGFLVKVETMLERAKLPLRPGEAMSFYAAGVTAAAVLGFVFFGGLMGALVGAFLAAVGAIFVVRFMASRRIRQFESLLPDTLQLLAGTLRAGYSLPQGLEAVSKESADPMGYELRRVMTEARLGRELEDALGSAAERLESPDFAWAVMAIGIQREVGGNLNELLMTVSDTMVARERLKGEVATLTAEGKMSAILLGGLPPGLGFIMWLMNPEYINQLFSEFLGNVFLGLGVVASLIGFAWMKKIITINV